MNPAEHPYQTPAAPPATASLPSVLPREEFDQQEWPIREQVILTVDDYIESMPVTNDASRFVPIVLLALSTCLIITTYILSGMNWRFRWPMIIVIGLALISVLRPFRFLMRSSMKKQLQRMERDDEEVLYEISPTELRIVTKIQDIRIRWDSFKYWRETDKVLMAYWNQAGYQIFPTARFTPLGASALRALLDPQKRQP